MIRVAVSYAVIAWLALQIADVTFEPLGVPRWVMVSLIVDRGLGFPVAVALAWFYEAGGSDCRATPRRQKVPRPVVPGLRRKPILRSSECCSCGRGAAWWALTWAVGAGNPAIAVLPFQNLSTSKDGEILALGIAESVLYQLANLAELDVISRTSSFAFRDRGKDAQEIGRELGARTCSKAACRATVPGCA